VVDDHNGGMINVNSTLVNLLAGGGGVEVEV
jgi:hypothetical protein